MFAPPHCPNPECTAHFRGSTTSNGRPFFSRHGYFKPRCRNHAVPRFLCRFCRRTFSRQTFRQSYQDKKPHLNARVFELLASGLGLRQTGRLLGLTKRNTELKARKISRHLGELHTNLHGLFPAGSTFQMDEMETFESERTVRPVTVPVLIEDQSMFISFVDAAPIRPSGRSSERRAKAIHRYETRFGRRTNRSREALTRLFRWLSIHVDPYSQVVLNSDEKILYGYLGRRQFGDRLLHFKTNSKRPRNSHNPLFRINLTNALARDLNGRLRRKSWLVSKRFEYLKLQLFLHAAYRNYVRPRFNRDEHTPGQILGFAPRRLAFTELLTWRQDWARASIHPLARTNESVADYQTRRAA